jgi:hypothetical protein
LTDSGELATAWGPVVAALEALNVAYYVGGSLASSTHGTPRSTLDVDLVADLRPEHVEGFLRSLAAGYYLDEARIRHAVAHRRSFNLIHLATMFKVDVFVSKDRPFDRSALARAELHPLGLSPAAGLVRVASPEDTVLAKLEWYRAGAETSERQWSDILGVLRTKRDALDRRYLDRQAEALAVSDLLDRALREAS